MNPWEKLKRIKRRITAGRILSDFRTRYRLLSPVLLRAVDDAVYGFDIVDGTGRFVYVNDAYLRMWGYEAASEVIGTSPATHCADPAMPARLIRELHEKGTAEVEFQARRRDGSLFDVLMYAHLGRDIEGGVCYYGTSIDISARNEYVKRLETTLREKDALMRELYHRTNNTLQLVASMLRLQVSSLPSGSEIARIVDYTDVRIGAISLIYDTLPHSDDLSSIELGTYLRELVEGLVSRMAAEGRVIDAEFCLQPVVLLFDSAVPCGLLISELVIFLAEHSSRDGGTVVTVGVGMSDPETVELFVRASGSGLGSDAAAEQQTGPGFGLVRELAEHQLQGTLRLEGGTGFGVVITFPARIYSPRI